MGGTYPCYPEEASKQAGQFVGKSCYGIQGTFLWRQSVHHAAGRLKEERATQRPGAGWEEQDRENCNLRSANECATSPRSRSLQEDPAFLRGRVIVVRDNGVRARTMHARVCAPSQEEEEHETRMESFLPEFQQDVLPLHLGPNTHTRTERDREVKTSNAFFASGIVSRVRFQLKLKVQLVALRPSPKAGEGKNPPSTLTFPRLLHDARAPPRRTSHTSIRSP